MDIPLDLGSVGDLFKIIVADIVLSGDNAIIIGMAAAGLSPELRKKAVFWGIAIAAILRIIFSLGATYLIDVPGLRFLGGLLLIWVCWRLFSEIREGMQAEIEPTVHEGEEGGYQGAPRKSLRSALLSITVADISMSLDNVLAVAAIADGDTFKLVFGLALAIALMAFAATLVVRLLTRYPIISWFGLAILLYVAGELIYYGWPSMQQLLSTYGINLPLGLN